MLAAERLIEIERHVSRCYRGKSDSHPLIASSILDPVVLYSQATGQRPEAVLALEVDRPSQRNIAPSPRS